MMHPTARRPYHDCRPTSFWAYLSDPMPTDGPDRLLEQRRIIDRTVAIERRRIDRYFVDSGSAPTDRGRSPNLQALIDEAQAAEARVILVVAAASHLAPTSKAILETVADLLAAGVILKDASGELHPAPGTVALAAAATAPRRRAKHDLERNDV